MRHRLLSRVAERIYWLGRYMERADNTARLISVNANMLMDMPGRVALGWRPLIDITGSEALFDLLYGESSERNVCRFLTCDARHSSAITSAISAARENARTVRETMPGPTFEHVNDLHLFAHAALGPNLSRIKRHAALEGISSRVQRLEGFLSQNMLHGAPWQLLRLGSRIERADMTTRIIDVRSNDLLPPGLDLAPFREIQWRSVLGSLNARQSYQGIVGAPVTRPLVLEFLFREPGLPRSYAYCLNAIRRHIRSLPRHEAPLRACDQAAGFLASSDLGTLDRDSLHRFLDECQVQLGQLHESITETWFRVPEDTVQPAPAQGEMPFGNNGFAPREATLPKPEGSPR
ncbi:MAG: alpha-E domain-containing protein [Gammaproteobacteria bacterium]|nr:alpha-E domain-containing protein [Gammaproteobacteria bacterium]